jgi:hypothetical protein
MHETLQQLFDEHDAPTHACKRDIHDALAPMVRLAASVQKQVLEYRTLVTEATLSASHEDAAMGGTLEHMHQTFGALETHAAALTTAARGIAQAAEQLDRYMAERRSELLKADASAAPTR